MKFDSTPVSIVKQLVSQGFEAYIVGGAVRDLMLGHQPKDYDIATIATPEEIRRVFGRRYAHIIGRRFLLVLLHRDGDVYEISTFRRAPTQKERRGRESDKGMMIWNDNQFGKLDDDVKRRDFTVNALYCDVAHGNSIVDKVGGMNDLNARKVRSIGDPNIRFQEDPVRMLRALKLVGQHNFTLTTEVRLAIRKHAKLISQASTARMFEELMKIFFCGKSASVLNVCHKYGLLKYILKPLDRIWDTAGGVAIVSMLRQRDRCILEDPFYFYEKSLAMATICVLYVFSQIETENLSEHDAYLAASAKCNELVKEFFAGYNVSREILYEVSNIIMLTATLSNGIVGKRVRESHLYPLAYELFRLITMACGWKSDVFNKLPYPEEDNK